MGEEKEKTDEQKSAEKKPDENNFFVLPKLNLEWQDYGLVIFLALLILAEYSVFGNFKQLPGPVYGGDLYYHYGHVQHIYYSNNPFASSHYDNEYEHYPWLTHFIIAFLSKLFSSAMGTYLYFPILMTVLGSVILYFLGMKLFQDKSISLILAMLWPVIYEMPSATPTSFATMIMIPVFVLSLLYTENRKTAVVSGILYGLAGTQHIVSFIGGSLFLALFFLHKIFFIKEKSVKQYLSLFFIILLIGIPIALLYWAPPIFVYKGNTPNNWQEYTGIGVQGLTFSYIGRLLKDNFFNTSSKIKFILSVFALLGLFYCFHKKNLHVIITLFLAGIIGVIHPWISQPLFGFSIGFYRFPIIFVLTRTLFIVCGIAFVIRSLKQQTAKLMVFSVSIILIIIISFQFISAYKTDRWAVSAEKKDMNMLILESMAKWVVANTDANAVFLSPHGESAFALAALTGRKVVHMRITHSSPYVDADQRIADAAIILYGKDPEKRKELIEKYKVSYIFEDLYSAESEKSCREIWEVLDKNPELSENSYSCLRVSNESLVPYLEKYGIKTKKVHARMDIASNNAPKFDLHAIYPEKGEFEVKIIKEEKLVQGSAARIMKLI